MLRLEDEEAGALFDARVTGVVTERPLALTITIQVSRYRKHVNVSVGS